MNSSAVANTKVNRIIIILIFISVFVNSLVLMKSPFEFYIGYLIFIILLPVFIFRYGLPLNISLIFFVLVVAGVLNIINNNNTVALFLKIFLGLFASYLFYYYVVVEFKYDVEKLFVYYLKGAYIVSVIGLIQFFSFQIGFKYGYDFRWILNKWGLIPGGNFGIRVNSIFGEPTYLGAVLSSAFFVSVNNLLSKNYFGINRKQSVVIIIVYFLSFSGLGYAGVLLSIILLLINFGLVRYLIVFVPVLIGAFFYLHENVKDFRERYDSTIEIFTTGKFSIGTTHGSSIILYNNYSIAVENFKKNPVFGTGLGSHPVAFEKYSLTKGIKTGGFQLNSADANSMLIRMLSETGLFGVILFLAVLFKCLMFKNKSDVIGKDSKHWIISCSIFVMIVLNLLRQGHYFLNGFPFFVWLYYFNYRDAVQKLSEVKLPTKNSE